MSVDWYRVYKKASYRSRGERFPLLGGLPLASIVETERRLGYPLPESLRSYYLILGELANSGRGGGVFRLDRLAITEEHLLLNFDPATGTSRGIPLSKISEEDPQLRLRAGVAGRWEWDSYTFSEFLVLSLGNG